jgi:hypothetical protein
MTDLREQYRATTLRILGNFQLLEFALKAYIGRCYKIIHSRVGGTILFDYSEKDVEDQPLGRLLGLFAKLNTNTELIARLRKLQTERNHIAHRSLLIAMSAAYDRGAVEDKYIEYVDLEDELVECLQGLIEENRQLKLRGQSAA